MLKHYPSGFSPYKSSGTDRRPFAPVEGEQVFIRYRLPGDELVDGKEPALILKLDQESKRVLAVKDPAYGQDCYLFRVGPFQADTKVRYSFEGLDDQVFRFHVRAKSKVMKTRLLFASSNRFEVLCSFANDLDYIFQGDATDGYMVLNAKPAGSNSLDPAAQGSSGKVLALPEGQLVLSADGSYFELINKNKKRLLQVNLLTLVGEFKDAILQAFSLEIEAVGEAIYGLGEKFDRVNQRGLNPHNIVNETFTYQGHDTYLPVPWMFSESGWGLFSSASEGSSFDLRDTEGDVTNILFSGDVGEDGFTPLYLFLGDPKAVIKDFVHVTGPAELPPKWAFGPWISANGWASQKEAEEQLDTLKELDIPASAIVLEAWSDECTFYIWNGAQYEAKPGGVFEVSDFTYPPDGPWPDPVAFSKRVKEDDLHLVLWQIPVIPGPHNEERKANVQLRMDLEEAIEKRYCAFNADGTPYYLPDLWFSGSLLLDFSNPEAVDWWMEKRRYLIESFGVEGFKTDGGEFVYDPNLQFYKDRTGSSARNLYPAWYTQSYYDYLKKQNVPGVLFSRAGYTGSQSRPLHWAGDQATTFSEMRSQVVAGLSAGLSGVLFWGFDIGGFTGDLPSTDFYLKSAAMGTFSPVMQFHSEPRTGQYEYSERKDWINDRSPWNIARVNNDPAVIDKYRYLSKLRMAMLPYLYSEADHCTKTGRPLMCHLVYDFNEDKQVLNIEDQYMLGRSLLVAPILEADIVSREVYLPEGQWYCFWSGKIFEGNRRYVVESEVGKIPVFTLDEKVLAKHLYE